MVSDYPTASNDQLATLRTKLPRSLCANGGVGTCSGGVPLASACPISIDTFQLVNPKDADKILGQVKPNTCVLNLCPSG